MAGLPVTVIQAGTVATSGLRFVPVTPCRVADTRVQGPMLTPSAPRAFGVRQSPCGIPASARAYSLNVTAVPRGPLGFLTLWPTGESQPVVSTLNSFDGSIVANAAIVPAGSDGSVSVFASNNTDVVLDINGYFAPGTGLAFFPVAPCRVVDTREAGLGPLFGPPALTGVAPQREFPLAVGRCGLPGGAQAYSLNVTVVPRGSLPFLTVWPSGVPRPTASTLNTFEGRVISNAVITPAGTNGAIQTFAFLGGSDAADLIVDVNGYFAPPALGSLQFYPVVPCRVADTRVSNGPFGSPNLGSSVVRDFPVPASVCGIRPSARAYSLNITAVPNSYLGYLTAWPTGAARPFVSTLNSWEGLVRANAAILPAGVDGGVSVFTAMNLDGVVDVILDVNGYFAP